MPAKTFNLTRKTNKQISKLPIRIQDKIDLAFETIRQNPISGSRMGGELSGSYKFRVGDWRIIYKFNAKESRLDVLKIEHRQGVYK